jgi:hypothetical protein
MSMFLKSLIALPVAFCLAQPAAVLRYPLPEMRSGDARNWLQNRRPQILGLFATEVYGKTPASTAGVHFRVDSVDRHALNGLAVRKQITVFFTRAEKAPAMHLLLYLPARIPTRVAVFVGLNFFGNETVDADPGIRLPLVWLKDAPDAQPAHAGEPAPESARGSSAHLWQVEKIIERGFGLATAYCGDIEPDFEGGMEFGIRHTFLRRDQTKPAADEWGALGAWAWGLSRIADYLETDPNVDPARIILTGFSRLGKAALWSAAQDPRFSMLISIESGVGGASLYRAATAETIEHLNTAFPYWFAENFHKYTDHPEQVPVDGDMLLALVAPRPLYVSSAEEDHSSDPPAEYLSLVEAGKVYRLFGAPSFDQPMPAVNTPLSNGVLGYHVRSGKHDVTAYDWDRYLLFAAQQRR